MNATQTAILRALSLARVLDVEHTTEDAHRAFRAVRHELETLRGIHCPQAPAAGPAPELKSAHAGRATRPGTMRHKIMLAVWLMPMADFQIRDRLAADRPDGPEWPRIGQVRRRRHELVAAGWMEPVLTRDLNRKVRHDQSGRDCTVYQLTDWGVKALRRLNSGQVALFSTGDLTS